jgi:hypothetical protein
MILDETVPTPLRARRNKTEYASRLALECQCLAFMGHFRSALELKSIHPIPRLRRPVRIGNGGGERVGAGSLSKRRPVVRNATSLLDAANEVSKEMS